MKLLRYLGNNGAWRQWAARWAFVVACSAGVIPAARADIAPSQVLVVYNSAAPEATALKDSYLSAHPTLPLANVLDLNNAALNVADLTRAQFVTLVRNPIRSYLLQAGPPDPAGIIAITLIRPFPHRLQDTDNPTVGDNPSAAVNEFYPGGDATYSSLDADLVLLWQDLETGEAGGLMDSKADNFIDNPYHQSATSIATFSRLNIQTQKTYLNYGNANVAWTLGGTGATKLTPGDIYLVCRIDGNTLADAQASIARAQNPYVNKAVAKIILDEYDETIAPGYDNSSLFSPPSNDPFYAGDDYELTRDALQTTGWNVRYDGTYNFISTTEETAPLIAYASYGENHGNDNAGENPPGTGTYLEGFNFLPGAMFNTIESYNARGLNGLGPLFGQEQVTDFMAWGGTFAIGHVYEPFSITIADNLFLFTRLLNTNLCWAEAAYASLPVLSWQHVVLGDPLGKLTIINDSGMPRGDMNGDGQVNGLDIQWFVNILIEGVGNYRSVFPSLDPVVRGDFNGDYRVTLDDLPDFLAALINDNGQPRGDMNGDGLVDGLDIQWFTKLLMGDLAAYRAAFPALNPIARGDFTGDQQVTLEDLPDFLATLLVL